VGFALTHFLSKSHHLPHARSHLASRSELFWQVYFEQITCLNWAELVESRVVRHTLGCLLARVAGKSPLEYLTIEERARQRDVVLALIPKLPATVPALIAEFIRKIEAHAKN
jgi:hypothetical protein